MVPKEIAEKAVAKDKKLKWEAAKWKVHLPVSINKISIQKEKRKWLLILKL
jgi:hypothetical protein